MKKLIDKYQIGGWFPIGYDNNIYRPTYGTMLPEVKVVAKGDPRKVNNDYYKAHSRARVRLQSRVADRTDYKGLNPVNILEYTPVIGDALDAGNIINDTTNKNYLSAGIGAGMFLLPNIIEKPLKKLIKPIVKDISKWTPEQWTAAQDVAIATGDMAEAQRLRDLHFKVSAPKTEIVDVDGNPQLVFHKTPNNFTVFDNSKSIGNLNWFATPNAYGQVFATGAGENPRIMKLYVNMRNGHKPTINENMEAAFINEGEDGIIGIVDKNMTNYFKSSCDAGKGFMMSGGVDNPYALKSADAITYDDKGVRIPLGKRDNFNINDIRYSLLPFILGSAYATTNEGGS